MLVAPKLLRRIARQNCPKQLDKPRLGGLLATHLAPPGNIFQGPPPDTARIWQCLEPWGCVSLGMVPSVTESSLLLSTYPSLPFCTCLRGVPYRLISAFVSFGALVRLIVLIQSICCPLMPNLRPPEPKLKLPESN
jgi:hypothetical protein